MKFLHRKGRRYEVLDSNKRIEYTCITCGGTRYNTNFNIQKQMRECLHCKKQENTGETQ